ncbi:MAG: hypothetical protein JNM83_15100 [Myxococcales bacterium]|jgi:hypothetical protein|nr:hypothetical protein [Myxococcales bacterium]
MNDYSYASLPDSLIVVGALVGFHDEERRVARLIRGQLLARLISRSALGERISQDTLVEDAASVLQNQPRRDDLILSACLVTWSSERISVLAAGQFEVWLAQDSGLSQILVGSSVYQLATEAGLAVERYLKHVCTAALSADRSKSVSQYVEMAYSPTDTLVITVGDVEPGWVVGRARALGRGPVVFAVDEGADLRLVAPLLCRRP